MREKTRAILALAAVAGLCAGSRAALVIAQAEAPIDGNYAPVDFAGRSTATPSSGSLAGIEFFADSGFASAGGDVSAHAASVGAEIYGADSPAHPYVSQVRALSSDSLLRAFLMPPPPRRTGKSPAPRKLPGGAKILNASFVGGTGDDSFDAGLLSRMDLLASRDGVLAVAGAVTDVSGSFQGSTLIWGAHDVLAIRGTNSATPFNPAADDVGRGYADLWGEGLASDVTGHVSGYAAALIGQANAARRPDLAKPATVRALLLAGADRSAFLDGQAWSADRPSGMSTELGAGEANLANAQSFLSAPIAAFLAAGKPKLKLKSAPPAQTSGVGALASIKSKATVISTFTLTADQASLIACLDWDAAQKNDSAGDLTLSLVPVTLGAKNVATLGTIPLLTRTSAGDTACLLTADMDIPAGTYAWVIKNTGKEALSPSLAYGFGATSTVTTSAVVLGDVAAAPVVPEPGPAGLLLAFPALACRRIRRGA